MNNLLAANLMRLRKNKCFWGGLIFMLAAGLYLPAVRYADMKQLGYMDNLENGFFGCAAFAAVILSVFCSLFIGTEYSDGTIRNKIIIGHKRVDIYLANLLTNMFAGLILCIVFFTAYLCIGTPLLGFFKADMMFIILFAITVIVLSFAFSAIFTLISMLNSNKAIAAVVCILSTVVLIMIGAYFNIRLEAPETLPVYNYTIDGKITSEEVKNPKYLEGMQREVYQFIYDILPGGQVIQCITLKAKNLNMLSVYASIVFLIMTSVGVVIFGRKDLK